MTTVTESSAPPIERRPSTYVTQHCAHGNCEGTKNKSSRGERFPSCRGTYKYRSGKMEFVCACKCHKDMRVLRQMAGLPEPDYEQTFAVPTSRLAGLSHTSREPADGDGDDTTGTDVRASLGNHSGPTTEGTTESGRLQRGVLEQRVYELCKMGPNQNVKTLCAFIAMRHGEEPSAGAVTAVLRRWERTGIATIADGPLRFVSFSERVQAIGLWEAKEEIERAGKRAAKGFF